MGTEGLIPEKEPTDWTSGTGLLSDLATLYKDGSQGANGLDWTLDGVSTGIDGFVAFVNPLGSAVAAGVGWLLEHVPIIDDAWNELSGDPEAIQRAAITWANIATRLGESSTDFGQDAKQIESWKGAAAESFRQTAFDYETILAGLADDTQTLSICITGMGCIVAALREIVYWLISDWLTEDVIPEALASLASSWFTFGASLAAFLAWLIITTSATAIEIGDKVGLCATKLAEVYVKIGELVERAAKATAAAKEAESALTAAAEKLDNPYVAGARGAQRRIENQQKTQSEGG